MEDSHVHQSITLHPLANAGRENVLKCFVPSLILITHMYYTYKISDYTVFTFHGSPSTAADRSVLAHLVGECSFIHLLTMSIYISCLYDVHTM